MRKGGLLVRDRFPARISGTDPQAWGNRAGQSPQPMPKCAGPSEQHKRALFSPLIAAERVSCCCRLTKGY
jgi:hypothetical protein